MTLHTEPRFQNNFNEQVFLKNLTCHVDCLTSMRLDCLTILHQSTECKDHLGKFALRYYKKLSLAQIIARTKKKNTEKSVFIIISFYIAILSPSEQYHLFLLQLLPYFSFPLKGSFSRNHYLKHTHQRKAYMPALRVTSYETLSSALL